MRRVEFSASEGLLLNGQRVKVQGFANHQDFAGVGVAVPDSLQAYRVARLQDMGANGWRTAHNPPSPALLDWTDRLGMLVRGRYTLSRTHAFAAQRGMVGCDGWLVIKVWDENHKNRAEGEWLKDLQSLVLRDRNHPSVVIWSLCNEVLCEQWNVTSATILRDEVRPGSSHTCRHPSPKVL